jgi:hypothetical protein
MFCPAQSDAKKKAQRHRMLVNAAHAGAVRLQVQQEGADILGEKRARRFTHMRRTPAHRRDVATLRGYAKTAQRHVVDHALAKGVKCRCVRHRKLPS